MKNKLVLKLLLSVVSTVLCLFFLAVSAELYLASKHKELLAKGGCYAELYNSQFEGVSPQGGRPHL